jgi:transglutaminase/protease-like cytokinesis protein 3
MEPNTFLNSHLPEDPDWQLIDNPITEAEFDARPKSSESFPGLSLGEFSKHFGQLGATLHSASKSVAKCASFS